MSLYRQMIPDDESRLRTMLNIREPLPLPDVVVKTYWVFRGFMDRAGSGSMSDELMTVLCWESNLRVPRETGPNVVRAIKKGDVKRGDVVLVIWRDAFRQATFHALKNNGKIEALLDDDPEVREFDPFDVEVADPAMQVT